MPRDFEICVANGGRVRTKSLPDGKFMRICFDKNGKSHAGEVMTKKEMEQKGYTMTEDLSLQFNIRETEIDEKKNTVVAGFLEEDVLSANHRFYPAKVVREAVTKLVGRGSMIGHDTDSVEDVVAKITRSEMRGRMAVAEFKFGTDEKSRMIFSKIKEGLVDSTSIRASGTTKRQELNGQEVDVVESLDIFSIDWVTSPGISSAKVLKVFESSPIIKEIKTMTEAESFADCKSGGGKMSMTDMGDGMAQMMCTMDGKEHKGPTMPKAEAEKAMKHEDYRRKGIDMNELEAMQKENKELKEGKEKAEKLADEQKLQAHIEKKLGEVKDDTHKAIVKRAISKLKTEAEINSEFAAIVEELKKAIKTEGDKDVVILASDGKNNEADLKFNTVNQLLESDKVDSDSKVKVLSTLLGNR